MIESLSPRLIFLTALLVGMGLWLYKDRKKIQRHTIIFYRRTENGLELIDKIAKYSPRFWNIYGWTGVATGIISMFGALLLVGYGFYQMLVTRSVEGGPSLILPGLVAENQFQAGVSFIPVEYWVVGIGVLMIVHEFSHGIVARAENFELNSIGWGIMGVFPFAFVEPKGEGMLPGADIDEDVEGHWEQGTWTQRLKVLCAGSFANYITAGLIGLLVLGITGFITQPSGLVYTAQDGFPAAEAGMNNGTIESINGVEVSTLQDLQQATEGLMPGDTVSLVTSEGNFTFEAGTSEEVEGGYIGIQMGQAQVVKDQYSDYQASLNWFVNMLATVAFLNFMIGLFNMMPIKPLDGGWTLEALVENYMGEKYLPYINTFTIAMWALLLGSMVLSLLIPVLGL